VFKTQIEGIGGIRMTREEAIYYLKASGMSDEQIKSVIDAFTCDDCISREAVEEITWEEPSYTDALNAITEIRDKIRQLPSVTPSYNSIKIELKPCEDCISREDAVKIASINSMPVYECVKMIKALPSVTPQPKIGKWINKGDYAECSNCGANSGVQYNGVEPVPLSTRYCPNCGAKMEVEE
jgi:hypothetical protein